MLYERGRTIFYVYIGYDLFHFIVTDAREGNRVSPSDIRSNWGRESLSDLSKATQPVNGRTKLRTGSFEPWTSAVYITPESLILCPTSRTLPCFGEASVKLVT